jgi:hypothetical protein
LAKVSGTDLDTTWANTGLSARTVYTGVTGSIANNITASVSITGAKSYLLYSIQTSVGAWVRLYTDATSRTSDSSRTQGTDPTPGSGVIAEVITSGAATQLITPGAIGFNNDVVPTTTIYASITNLSGSTSVVTVTLSALPLE